MGNCTWKRYWTRLFINLWWIQLLFSSLFLQMIEFHSLFIFIKMFKLRKAGFQGLYKAGVLFQHLTPFSWNLIFFFNWFDRVFNVSELEMWQVLILDGWNFMFPKVSTLQLSKKCHLAVFSCLHVKYLIISLLIKHVLI